MHVMGYKFIAISQQ